MPTGIDRVCYAYLDHFAARSQAVVQHRGVFRILGPRDSDRFFGMLSGPDTDFRRKLAGFAPSALARGAAHVDGAGAVYLNVSHTDYDLPAHARWTRRCRLRPTYLIHDLIPITHSQFCRPHAVTRHRGRVAGALGNAAGIIVNSMATAGELKAFSRRQRLPMPPTLAAPLAGASLSRTAAPLYGEGDAYFLCVGTIEPRKNHRLLLDVWRRMAEDARSAPLPLVIVGQWGADSAPLRAMLRSCPALRRHVTVIDRCSDAELGRWIAGAEAVLMPTLAEGFGLPVVEALQLGTPVIASDIPCFREIGQGIPSLLDPLDIDGWQRAITSFARPGGERDRQIAALPAFRPTTWRSHFSDVESWLSTLPPLGETVASAPAPGDDARPQRRFAGALGK